MDQSFEKGKEFLMVHKNRASGVLDHLWTTFKEDPDRHLKGLLS
jgi:hypothetical protein